MSPSLPDVSSIIPSALLLACLAGPAAPASAAVATASLQVDGSAVAESTLLSEIGPTGGTVFVGALSLEGVDASWNYASDLDAAGNALINGAMVFINTSDKVLHVRGTFAAPLCPAIIANGKVGGFSKITLTANADGGQITCPSDGKEASAAVSDGTITWTMFPCPFNLSSTGGGNASTVMLFGSPFPSAPGPSSISSVGQAVDFMLTPGDKASLSLLYVVGGTYIPLPPVECPGDINGDGVVDGGDLPAVLAAMETIAVCGDPAELTGDGIIDGADLAVVLGNWGPCPQGGAGG